ncbi:Bifunctional transcriptional activator/DNA repair enzyme Ada [Maioricimonas rarisocia]|uniref:methylated-DNA--[protein]-cysteine S-methyltransferase n=1 Tax=Maioricimonas rarisocia TaxID=2528026 RepID=A0A517ZBX3_9PLAN|nr:bifunctional DNA-binding transcriptional regulator/O6-methylguanine-DNA methyltransferase Ada [Maioricimonas rarisocia]QDU39940.1 Bifunctional transcriptional activator/DNA repair enzyme Ada [Maioricimonas rarisocia]
MPATATRSDDDRWQAVLNRDPAADGMFYYAVRTTGIYCRPVCTARRPNRSNVEFFESAPEAERHGYRSCLKCRPHEAVSPLPEAVLTACRTIDAADAPPSLEDLGRKVGLSPGHLHRLFRSTIGMTPRQYAEAGRAERFRRRLQQREPVTHALHAAGYQSASTLYESAGETLGMTPAHYRNGGTGESIRAAVVRCSLGWIAVAATERGVCMVEPGDDSAELESLVTSRFPNAEVDGNDDQFRQWVSQLVSCVDGLDDGQQLPLDLKGTVFQRRVWTLLRSIPPGTTITYTELAKKLGKPTAARAVASACAANQLAVVVPCHRVVRSDGSLSGYRWGVERKRELLDRESSEQP